MRIIGGVHKGRKLFSETGRTTRPTLGKVRETLFNICQNTIEGTRFLDLFAGFGAIGLEALSRGSKHASFVENDREALRMIQKNIAHLGEESRALLYSIDVFKALKRFADKRERFDIIFADPPYGQEYGEMVLKFIDSHPLLAPCGELFIEDTLIGEIPLIQLKLKSARRIGRAFLHQYASRG